MELLQISICIAAWAVSQALFAASYRRSRRQGAKWHARACLIGSHAMTVWWLGAATDWPAAAIVLLTILVTISCGLALKSILAREPVWPGLPRVSS